MEQDEEDEALSRRLEEEEKEHFIAHVPVPSQEEVMNFNMCLCLSFHFCRGCFFAVAPDKWLIPLYLMTNICDLPCKSLQRDLESFSLFSIIDKIIDD